MKSVLSLDRNEHCKWNGDELSAICHCTKKNACVIQILFFPCIFQFFYLLDWNFYIWITARMFFRVIILFTAYTAIKCLPFLWTIFFSLAFLWSFFFSTILVLFFHSTAKRKTEWKKKQHWNREITDIIVVIAKKTCWPFTFIQKSLTTAHFFTVEFSLSLYCV